MPTRSPASPLLTAFVAGLLIALLGGAQPAAAQSGPPPLATFDSAWVHLSRTYYDTALIAGRWQAVRDSLRRSLGATPSLDRERTAIRALIAVPGQSHFALIPAGSVEQTGAKPRRVGPPGSSGLELRVVGDSVLVWRVEAEGAAAVAGVRPGSWLLGVEKLQVGALRRDLAQAFADAPRSADAVTVALVQDALEGPVGDTVRVRLLAPGADTATSLTLRRTPMPGRTTQYGNLPPIRVRAWRDSTVVRVAGRDTTIPIIGFSAWFPLIIPDLDRWLFDARGARGVILDLRGNIGGAVGILRGFAGHFADTSWSLGTLTGRGSVQFLAANPRRATPAGERVDVIRAPIAILVDGQTASSSEFFAAGMQAIGRARIFGEPTAGQSLPAAMIRLPSGDVLMNPIADHVDAAGRRIEGSGVRPDTPTPLVRSEVAAGRDAALEAARAWLAEVLARP